MRILAFIFLDMFISSLSIGQNTILWSISDSLVGKQSFLLGTYHQMGNSFVDSIPQIKLALSSSDLAVFETVGVNDDISNYMNNRENNYDYKKILKKSDLVYLENLSQNWNVPISKVFPIELLLKLNQTYSVKICGTVKSTDEWDHFDKYLMSLALKDTIPLYGLETDSMQIQQINNLSKSKVTWTDVKRPIHKILMDIKYQRHRKTYCRPAVDYMTMQFNYQFTDSCSDKDLESRNDKWITQLDKMLLTKNCFIAIGLLHLYGKCGLIVQLRQRGYKVEPIELKIHK